jgi:hypothetical protein
MSRKRARDDDAGPVKFEEVTRAVLRIIATWRDACDSEYDVRTRVETRDDASVLRIGAFDELTCKRVVAVLDAKLPGDYTITEGHCDVAKRALVCVVRRSWGSGGGDASVPKEARTGSLHSEQQQNAAVGSAPSASGVGGSDTASSDFTRMRVSTMLNDKHDAAVVATAMSNVMQHMARGVTWTLTTAPAFYFISFKLSDAKLSSMAVREACACDARSSVDFERGTLRLCVPKSHPDIV